MTLAHPRLLHPASLSSAPLPESQTPEAGVYSWDRTAASRLTLECLRSLFGKLFITTHRGETKDWEIGSLASGNTAQPLTYAPAQWTGKGMCVKDKWLLSQLQNSSLAPKGAKEESLFPYEPSPAQ